MTAPKFSLTSVRDPQQLTQLLQRLSLDLEDANRKIANLQIAQSAPQLSLNTVLAIRSALQASGVAPLNVASLVGILAQSQRGFAVVASTAATLPSPAHYEVGTLGAVLSGSTLTFYLVAEGMPRTWVAQTSLAITAIDNSFTIEDDADGTKKIRFEAGSIAAGNTRVQTVPDTDQILAGRNVNNSFSVSQTITNAADAVLRLLVNNTNAVGVGADAIVQVAASTAIARIVAFGAGFVGTILGISIANWSALHNAAAGSGLIVATLNATPLVFGTNDVERARIDATGVQITAGTLRFSPAASQVVPGATSLSLRNNANSADNVLISDAGAVTIRALLTALAGITVSAGNLTFGAASAKIIPGATQLSLRNNADSADNLLISNAGAVTVRSLLTALAGVTISAGSLTLGDASSKIVPGATQLSLRNNADSADNVLVSDLGAVTIRDSITFGAQAVVLRTGTIDPNGATTGKRGDIYLRTGIDTTNLYVKQTGDGTNTGWVVK